MQVGWVAAFSRGVFVCAHLRNTKLWQTNVVAHRAVKEFNHERVRWYRLEFPPPFGYDSLVTHASFHDTAVSRAACLDKGLHETMSRLSSFANRDIMDSNRFNITSY